MHREHNRDVKISKEKLIAKIKENKENHIKEYEEAVKEYVIEANKQLKKAKLQLKKGDLNIGLRLTVPINRASEYDKVIEMFNWEVKDEVELSQQEFNDYVHDDNDSARLAKMSNSFYSRSKY